MVVLGCGGRDGTTGGRTGGMIDLLHQSTDTWGGEPEEMRDLGLPKSIEGYEICRLSTVGEKDFVISAKETNGLVEVFESFLNSDKLEAVDLSHVPRHVPGASCALEFLSTDQQGVRKRIYKVQVYISPIPVIGFAKKHYYKLDQETADMITEKVFTILKAEERGERVNWQVYPLRDSGSCSPGGWFPNSAHGSPRTLCGTPGPL
jgi:hypothetical protein